jgi:predicted acetyltransferase
VTVLTEDFAPQRLGTADDVEQHLKLMRNVFGEKSGVDLQVRKWIDHHPSLNLADFLVIKHRGKMVAALNLIPSEWSIGGIPLKVAELGCVATLEEYRHQGLQRRLMAEYHERVSEQEYDLCAIEGIPYFYRQFGYEYALPLDEQIRIRLDEIPNYASAHAIRPFACGDISRAMQLFGRAQKKFYVHITRNSGIWRMQQETSMAAEYKFEGYSVEQDGEMIAYFRMTHDSESKELFLREVTDVDQSAARSILSFLKEKGLSLGYETLVCTISHHEPFIEHLMASGEAEQPRPYAWQIRVTDYVRLFSKMKPLFERRLRSSKYHHMTEKVSLNFYRYTVQLTFEDGIMTDVQRLESSHDRTIRFNPIVFTQLLLGYRSLEELESIYPDFIVRPSYKELIDTLFPKLPSYVYTGY